MATNLIFILYFHTAIFHCQIYLDASTNFNDVILHWVQNGQILATDDSLNVIEKKEIVNLQCLLEQ